MLIIKIARHWLLSGLNQTVDQERLAVCFLPPYMVGTKIARSRGHIKAGN